MNDEGPVYDHQYTRHIQNMVFVAFSTDSANKRVAEPRFMAA